MNSPTNQGIIRIKRQLIEIEQNIIASHKEEKEREEKRAINVIKKIPNTSMHTHDQRLL